MLLIDVNNLEIVTNNRLLEELINEFLIKSASTKKADRSLLFIIVSPHEMHQ